jgi:hypothetical protein
MSFLVLGFYFCKAFQCRFGESIITPKSSITLGQEFLTQNYSLTPWRILPYRNAIVNRLKIYEIYADCFPPQRKIDSLKSTKVVSSSQTTHRLGCTLTQRQTTDKGTNTNYMHILLHNHLHIHTYRHTYTHTLMHT